MRKNILVLIISLFLVIGLVSYWFATLSSCYEQTIGNFFTYVLIILFVLLVLYPFKLIKDKKEIISVFSYLKFAAIGVFLAAKALLGYIKEIALTILYVSNSLIRGNSNARSTVIKQAGVQDDNSHRGDTEIVSMSETSDK